MKVPKICPVCKNEPDIRDPNPIWLFERGTPMKDSIAPHQVEDSICECVNCHTLFRLRWQLVSIHILTETDLSTYIEEKKESEEMT